MKCLFILLIVIVINITNFIIITIDIVITIVSAFQMLFTLYD
jgi:hypothetical protein